MRILRFLALVVWLCLQAVPIVAEDLRRAQCILAGEAVILSAQKARTYHGRDAVDAIIDNTIDQARQGRQDERTKEVLSTLLLLMQEAADIGYTEGEREQGMMDYYYNVNAARDAFVRACLDR